MNNKTPPDQLVKTIDMPQGVWPRNTAFPSHSSFCPAEKNSNRVVFSNDLSDAMSGDENPLASEATNYHSLATRRKIIFNC